MWRWALKRTAAFSKTMVLLACQWLGALALLGGSSAGAQIPEVKLIASDGAKFDDFGEAAAISGDTVVIGSDWDFYNTGAAYVFVRSGSSWTQQAKLTANDANVTDNFAANVSVSGDTIIAGAVNSVRTAAGAAGSAYVFTRSGGVWTQQAKLTASSGAPGDHLGHGVSVSGDTAIVGTRCDHVETNIGAAYIFVRSGTAWTQQAKLTASDAAMGDMFGNSVAVSGDTAVVGSIGTQGAGWGGGAAYVFTRSGSTWTQQAKLSGYGLSWSGFFLSTVSISGDTAMFGGGTTYAGVRDSGVVCVYTRTGSEWTQQARLTAPNPAPLDGFGYCVSVSGDTAAVGTYFFTRSGGVWTPQARLATSDAGAGEFGSSPATDAGRVIVGAPDSDGHVPESGAAYVFDLTLPRAPVLFALSINGGADTATTRTVTLNNVCSTPATEAMASESPNFAGASWQPYSAAPSFTLSPGNGTKAVFLKTRNTIGESNARSDAIVLSEPPNVSCFRIDSGAASTTNSTVTLNNSCTNSPMEYMASEFEDFAGASWRTYSTAPAFALSRGNGAKTVYFKVRNDGGESAAVSDTIVLHRPPETKWMLW